MASQCHMEVDPEQALADFAVLVTDLKQNLSAEACSVVLFGGSYGGTPVLQFEDIVPPETFYNIVSNGFLVRCSLNLIIMKLGSVDDLSNWLDAAYSYLAMVNYPYPANFMMPLPGNPIKEDNCCTSTPTKGTILRRRLDEVLSRRCVVGIFVVKKVGAL
ncbi:lysosomal Pro-Xaa carboxypeptidase, partial [Sarracenia purpurea var. burkii]